MISITIDGQPVEVEEGTTILEAAQRLGIHIPALCHHPALEPYGACRLCTVEIAYNGRSRLVTSCNYPIRWEMDVQTASEKVVKGRKLLAELLLARCPNAPKVQEIAASFGVTETRFEPGREDELCYLCGLCVRICEELIGQSAISFVGRGVDRAVGAPFLKFSDDCIACGACEFICPTGAIKLEDITDKEPQPLLSDFEMGLAKRGNIHIPFPQAVPNIPVIDGEHCLHATLGRCGACEHFCEVDAIDYDQQDEIIELEVGTIVVATGFDLYDASLLPQYGYGRYPDVLDGLQFERMTSNSGPTGGKILTADGQEPETIAILHCIGSRDEEHKPYCSRVCCMYAMKQAHLAHELSGAEVYEFYIDIRAPGKGYEEFYERNQREGIHFVRGKVAEVERENGRLLVRAEDTLRNRVVEVPVDMVVLMTAMQPAARSTELGQLLGISRDKDGWFAEAHPKLRPVDSNTDGIFLAGCAQFPKDIPDAVAQASGAASQVVRLLNRGEVSIDPAVAEVIEERCSGCGECVLVCPYSAIQIVDEHAWVNPTLCKGCGTCAAACLAKAIHANHFTDEELVAEVVGVLAEEVAW